MCVSTLIWLKSANSNNLFLFLVGRLKKKTCHNVTNTVFIEYVYDIVVVVNHVTLVGRGNGYGLGDTKSMDTPVS